MNAHENNNAANYKKLTARLAEAQRAAVGHRKQLDDYEATVTRLQAEIAAIDRERNAKVIVEPGLFRHYKGDVYEAHGIARHSEHADDAAHNVVVYRNVTTGQWWVRPPWMWHQPIIHNDSWVQRYAAMPKDLATLAAPPAPTSLEARLATLEAVITHLTLTIKANSQ